MPWSLQGTLWKVRNVLWESRKKSPLWLSVSSLKEMQQTRVVVKNKQYNLFICMHVYSELGPTVFSGAYLQISIQGTVVLLKAKSDHLLALHLERVIWKSIKMYLFIRLLCRLLQAQTRLKKGVSLSFQPHKGKGKMWLKAAILHWVKMEVIFSSAFRYLPSLQALPCFELGKFCALQIAPENQLLHLLPLEFSKLAS